MQLRARHRISILGSATRTGEIALGLITFLLVVAPASAQSGVGGGDPGYMRGRRSGGMMRQPEGGRSRLPSSDEVEGPATPGAMQQIAGLDGDQIKRYTRIYEQHMAATKPARDSVRTALQATRQAFESGDMQSARPSRDLVVRLWKDVSKQDEEFDKGLKSILTKDQVKQYSQWREDEKKEAEAQRQEEMRGRFGGRRPDGQSVPDAGPQ
jgi:hypothetical protein